MRSHSSARGRGFLGLLLLLGACAHTGASVGPGGRADVIIVGGGLGGLVTAYELQKRGVTAHVLEADSKLGGKVQTARYGNGLIAEYGLQEIWESSPLVGLARELKLELQSGGEGMSSVLLDGKIVPYIEDTPAAYLKKLFSPEEIVALDAWMADVGRLIKVAHTQGLTPELAKLQDLSMEDWLTKVRPVPRRVAEWVNVTLSCELGSNWKLYSALAGLLEFKMFLNGGEKAFHVHGGNARLIDALAAAHTGPRTLGARVTHVERTVVGGKPLVRVRYLKDNQTHVVEGSRVVMSVPWVYLPQIQFEPPIDAARRKAFWTLLRGSYVVVHFLIDKAARGMFEIDKKSIMPVLTVGPAGVIYGINESSDATQRQEVFTLLIFGTASDEWHMEPQEDKLRAVLAELDQLWPGFSKHVQASHVYAYHPLAVSTWPVGRSPLDAGAELLRKPDRGMYFASDWIENSHSEGAVIAAQRVAGQIAAELRPPPGR